MITDNSPSTRCVSRGAVSATSNLLSRLCPDRMSAWTASKQGNSKRTLQLNRTILTAKRVTHTTKSLPHISTLYLVPTTQPNIRKMILLPKNRIDSIDVAAARVSNWEMMRFMAAIWWIKLKVVRLMSLKSLPRIAKKLHGIDHSVDRRVNQPMLAIVLSIRATLLLLEYHEVITI